MKKTLILLLSFFIGSFSFAQQNEQLGSWYMYFGNFRFKDSPWAIHGEAQHRNYNILGDLDQLLLRTGLQYNLKSGQASFLAGYASITSGALGESKETFHESRIYQEAIVRQKLGKVGLMHRYRFEQRWIENQDLRTRFRYAVFVNVPLNSKDLAEKGSLYFQVYDELFINGQRTARVTQIFDRNRLYAGLGYRVAKGLAFQLGFMEQTTANFSNSQLQFSCFHQLYGK
ncbi:DUF2490 domain-containing protein [Algoriphagus mannitolivorans]|uniref:DUF2490 domain-containing protein n=1 Tax=Algoriphagus mannitolivorans TaxID=226504 RepID=UPI00041B8124|nr:DUF2490 domain-containing protein [Algoriphagus mannitolivorans]